MASAIAPVSAIVSDFVTSTVSMITSGSEDTFRTSGIDLMVLRLFVVSSPVIPSPRVAPLTNLLFS